tara:strand:- start:802 stop:1242 length:441 start_codon:yes stop_codon:yes gene_type:complete
MSNNNSKKHPPKMSNTELQTAFNDVYKHLNEIFDSVNSENLDIKSEGSGKPGDMRIVEKKNKQTSLEVRTDEGWFESNLFDSTPNVVKLTNSTGVTANTTIVDCTASYVEANVNGNFSDLATKLNEIIDILNNMNEHGFSMIKRRS